MTFAYFSMGLSLGPFDQRKNLLLVSVIGAQILLFIFVSELPVPADK